MTKPGCREHTLSDEIARFTDREDQRGLFQFYLNSPTEPPVLMFYGIGGAGQTWLLEQLQLDTQAGSQRFTLDPAAALYEIRQQIGRDAPRFDLAFAMLLHKQGLAKEPGFRGQGALGLAAEVAAEVAQKVVDYVPGVNVVLERLSDPLRV